MSIPEMQLQSMWDEPEPESRFLYQCPYEKACMCSMEEPCNGCETWAKALRKKQIKFKEV